MLNEKQEKTVSKFLSLVLRHEPKLIGITPNESGWVNIEELKQKALTKNQVLTDDIIKQVVANNDKKRFSISSDGTMIRANQGHSIEVNLGLEDKEPPEFLYHGTAQQYVQPILEQGLISKDRHAVHLSQNTTTATQVGSRHGKVVLFKVLSGKMHEQGYKFQCSDNNVWLTDAVPPQFLEQIEYKPQHNNKLK